MIDGKHISERCIVVALAICVDGTKVPVGSWDGATKSKVVVTALLADLVARGLDARDGLLVVIDGAKAFAAGVREVLGSKARVQRRTIHSVAASQRRQSPARQGEIVRRRQAR
jgi:transposase-like protein